MAGEDKVPTSRLSLALPAPLRSRLQDTAFILQRSENDVAAEALRSWLEAVERKMGDKFSNALKVIREARAPCDDSSPS